MVVVNKEIDMRTRLFMRLLLSAAIVIPVLSYGGTTGKIKGKVTDGGTGEALIGASVVVVGTSLGAAADINGEFIILSVPAGTYELEGQFLGYQALRVSNVLVNSDLTTEVDLAMTALAEGVVLGEIVVQRERELVSKNATNAVRIQTGADIENLPVRGVTAAVALVPGIVQQNGRIYVRGGRAEDVGYYLDGASTRNVFGRRQTLGANSDDWFSGQRTDNLTSVIPEALEEFQVQAGGYIAEYGGSNAGIVRQTLKSGGPAYHASLQVETDNFTGQNEERLGTFSYGYSDYVLTLSGPIVSDKVRFFIAGENQFDRDWRKVFWEGFRFENLPDANANEISRKNGFPDTIDVLEVLPGNIPGMSLNRYTTNGTLTFDYNPFIARLSGAFSWERRRGHAQVIPDIFNISRTPTTDRSDVLLSAKLTHIVSPHVLYEVSVNYQDNRDHRYDPELGDDVLAYKDSVVNAALGYNYRSIAEGPGNSNFGGGSSTGYRLYGFPFDRPGEPQTNYQKRKMTRFGGSVDMTAQLGTIHEFKAGGSVNIHKLRLYRVGRGAVNLLVWYRNNPDQARIPGDDRDFSVADNGQIDNYGYDVYGNEVEGNFIQDGVDGPKEPRYWSAYVQDKIEYEDLVVNAGLRLDIFDNDDFTFVDDPTTPGVTEDSENPSIDPETKWYRRTGLAEKKAFKAVSPRLSVSFPVSDRTVFYFQFGKFIQAPPLNTIYTSRRSQGISFEGGNFIPNPAGFGLDPERTTQYEIGFRQQISDFGAFDITGYYKDIKGQIQIRRITVASGAEAGSYNALVNGDFVTTKGVELSFRLRRTNRIQAQISYTFADAKGTGSSPNSSVSALENITQLPTVISPLDFNNAHRGSFNIDYRFAENDGGPILERLGANVLFTFNSGHPFTLSGGSIGQQGPEQGALVENDPRTSFPLEAINASTTPANFNIDLRLDKTVGIGPLAANFFIYVQNLLNTKNVINVYRRTGNAEDDGFLSNSELSGQIVAAQGQEYADLYRAINLANGTHYFATTGLDLWGTPRQIRFGMKLEL
jgi:outer membrane receptor protein involved in Fe transport